MKRLTPDLWVPFLFTLSLYFIPAISTATSRDIPKGQMIFEQRCAACHGFNAKGSYPMSKTLKVDPLVLDLTKPGTTHRSMVELQAVVSNGHYKMPKHREALTPRQIRAVVKYLRSLQTSLAYRSPR